MHSSTKIIREIFAYLKNNDVTLKCMTTIIHKSAIFTQRYKGRRTGASPESSQCELCCHAATSLFYSTSNLHDMRRKSFTPTAAEIEYWRKIHDLNEQEKPAVPIEKPAPVREYIIQTFELFTIDDCHGKTIH